MRNVSREMFRCLFEKTAAIVLFAAFLISVPFHAALAATAPSLGTAQSFAVLGASEVTNTGPTTIIGDLGVSPGTAVSGFPPGLVTGGTIHASDAVALQAQTDTTAAYGFLAGQACSPTNNLSADLGGMTLVPGVYCFSSSAQLTGALTLNAQGDPNAVWIFQIGSTLTTASNSSVLFINGAQPCNVFWQVGSSATIGTGTTFVGNILALTSISLNTTATISGRALARTGAVTMDSNQVAITACSVQPVGPFPPTLNKAFGPATINADGTSTLTIILSNPDAAAATLTAPLIDTLPAGVTTVAGSAATTCVGGTGVTATSSSVTLASGASIPAQGSCTVTVNVTAAVASTYLNTLGIGALITNHGINALPAVATLVVNPVTPPTVPFVTLSKAFSPPTINEQGTSIDTSTLTLTLSNPNVSNAILSAALIDTLPAGVTTVAGSVATTCVGGTGVTATSGSVTLASGASIPAQGSCTVTVNVTAAVAGSYFNSIPAGALLTDQGTYPAPAEATLAIAPIIIVPPPTVGKAFSPNPINVGDTSTLTITLSNLSTTSPAAISSFADILPTGMVFASPANPGTNCPSSSVVAATIGGISTVTFTGGGSLDPSGSCTVTVNVTAVTSGTYTNHLGTASATLTVNPVIPPQTPGLSLTKTPNMTTYTSVGQVIIYTYVLKNTGDVTLTGPFKVTDDKLGSFACGAATSLAPGASVTCTKKYTIKASDLGNVVSLPTGVTATIDTGGWLEGSMSTQSMTISGATPGVPNGNYPGWCIQDYVPNDLHNQTAKLYSTIGGSLPSDVAGLSWNKVNYVLNHKIRGAGKTNLEFFKDVQTAIWVLLGEPDPEFGISATAQQMINKANANANFVPRPSDTVAVIIYSDGMLITPQSIQEAICEMKLLKSIVNKATGSGKFGNLVVKSGQVTVTIKQTLRQ